MILVPVAGLYTHFAYIIYKVNLSHAEHGVNYNKIKNPLQNSGCGFEGGFLAGVERFELPTQWLTATCSAD